jgi:hypothetical protein
LGILISLLTNWLDVCSDSDWMLESSVILAAVTSNEATDRSSSERFATLVETMLERSAATFGDDQSRGARRSFGATSLKANGKIFAMLVADRLVVKLAAARVDELVAQGAGERFDPGHGRVQREWLSVTSDDPADWLALASEAERFVGAAGDRR